MAQEAGASSTIDQFTIPSRHTRSSQSRRIRWYPIFPSIHSNEEEKGRKKETIGKETRKSSVVSY
jgi:hypothetical protein